LVGCHSLAREGCVTTRLRFDRVTVLGIHLTLCAPREFYRPGKDESEPRVALP
jgi:hypothetical protein